MRYSVPAMFMTLEIDSKSLSFRAGLGEKVNDRLGSLSHVGGVSGGRDVDAVGAREREGQAGLIGVAPDNRGG